MKTIKILSLFAGLMLITSSIFAQDAIILSPGNFIRGTIQNTDFKTVDIRTDDGSIKQFTAKDIQEFLWNGQTFVAKPFISNNKTDYRFFKLIESGEINLYSMGERNPVNDKAKKKRIRFSPSFGLGVGTGGYRGFGFGGGITFGGSRAENEPEAKSDRRALIYIDSADDPETMLEITPDQDQNTENTNYIKDTLIKYMYKDQDLVNRIKNVENIDIKTIISFIQAYNSVHTPQ